MQVPGTQVLVADGTYREAVTFPASGTAGNWIQVKAEGNAAVLDSADRLSGNIWTLTSTVKSLVYKDKRAGCLPGAEWELVSTSTTI